MKFTLTLLSCLFLLQAQAQSCLGVTVDVVHPSCDLAADGSIMLTPTNGTAPYTYSIDNGITFQSGGSFTNLGTICYDLVVMDAMGCDFTAATSCLEQQFYITQTLDAEFVCTEDESLYFNPFDPLNGTAPYTYLWSTGETTESGTFFGTSLTTITITDANGCQASSARNAFPIISYDFNLTNATCNGYPDGSISVATQTITGYDPLIFWSTGSGGPFLNNLSAGIYYVTLDDTYGCVVTDSVEITAPENIVVENIVTHPTCTTQGQITCNVTGGTPPYYYQWEHGATTATVDQLNSGNYALTVYDASYCATSQVVITLDPPLDLDFSISPPTCGNADGSITVTALDGQGPFSYLWNTGATTATATGLAKDWYSLTLTDDGANCRVHQNIYLDEPNDCYATIAGYVLADSLDCVTDASTTPFVNRLVSLSLANGTSSMYTFTDSMGYYEFLTPTGEWLLSIEEQPLEILNCPAQYTNTINAPQTDSIYSLDYYINPIKEDLAISISMGASRPGFIQNYSLNYANNGILPINDIVITFVHDSILTDFNANNTESSYDALTYTATWEISSLPAGASGSIPINFEIPATTAIGTTLTAAASIVPDDELNENNSQTVFHMVTGSYDPNDKQNLSAADPFSGDIHPDVETYNYLIRFQNTGNDTAFTVVIRDEIDANLDISSIKPLAASHAFSMDFEGENGLVFFFENIMLPDSNINEPLSHGFVSFEIKRKANLALGTEINNTADIYFDFNAPIVTNTVTNTLAIPDGIIDRTTIDFTFAVHPNPLEGAAFIALELEKASRVKTRVLDIHGRQVLVQTQGMLAAGNHALVLDYTMLPSGIYFVEVETDAGVLTRKVVR